jgi:wyosine [tRNA(Phe)-imidazoG37] synthetase (radical SAM superfamily)
MREFAHDFQGELVTETMLIAGLNDGPKELERIADFLAQLELKRAYIAIPTRPPAESWVQPPDEEKVNLAYNIFSERLTNVEYLIGYEGDAFASTGDVAEDLLSITAVHPMRREAVEELLQKAGESWEAVAQLLGEGKLVELEYGGHKFYMRRLPTKRR